MSPSAACSLPTVAGVSAVWPGRHLNASPGADLDAILFVNVSYHHAGPLRPRIVLVHLADSNSSASYCHSPRCTGIAQEATPAGVQQPVMTVTNPPGTSHHDNVNLTCSRCIDRRYHSSTVRCYWYVLTRAWRQVSGAANGLHQSEGAVQGYRDTTCPHPNSVVTRNLTNAAPCHCCRHPVCTIAMHCMLGTQRAGWLHPEARVCA